MIIYSPVIYDTSLKMAITIWEKHRVQIILHVFFFLHLRESCLRVRFINQCEKYTHRRRIESNAHKHSLGYNWEKLEIFPLLEN